MSNHPFGYNPELPENIRDIFMWLCQDVASLHNKWLFYKELFSKENNIHLLNEVAPGSFQIIQETLRNDMTLAICRLSDSRLSNSQENLSFDNLVGRLGEPTDIKELLLSFLDACSGIRKYRHKRIGHNDLKTTLRPHEYPLPGIGRSQIDQIVYLAERILNGVYQHFVSTELFFEPLQIGGAESLLFWLRKAKDCHTREIDGLKRAAD